jgi:hypothetical protein
MVGAPPLIVAVHAALAVPRSSNDVMPTVILAKTFQILIRGVLDMAAVLLDDTHSDANRVFCCRIIG